MHLKSIAVVRSGLVLSRKQAKQSTRYRYQSINLRSINENEYIDINELDVYYAVEPLNPDYLTRKGDILVRLSSPYTAVLIDTSTEGLIFSSNFAVIRADTKKILPEYLFWLINNEKIKKDILKNSAGNMLAAIRPNYFSELERELLPLEAQRQIGSMYILAKHEIQLLQDLSKAKEKYYKITIDEIQKRMRKDNNHDNKR